jgi:26S proteasome regulatory subunit N6
MKAVADAHAKQKVSETALRDFKAQLEEDPIFHRHLSYPHMTFYYSKTSAG